MKTYADRHDDDRKKRKVSTKKMRERLGEMDEDEVMRMIDDSNDYVNRVFAGFGHEHSSGMEIQMKMEISQPEDHSEMQADEMAESFMDGDEELSQEILSQPAPAISRKGEGGGIQTSNEFDQQLQSTKGQGQKIDEGTKSELEQHTGKDLSGVNIHTNSQAHDMSENINAKAFAHGQDIYFKQGNYNPQSEEGKSLLAHEVAHTVQQGNGVERKIQRQPDKNKDLESVWFKGIQQLEDAYDGILLIQEGDSGSHVKRIQQALMFLMIDIGPDKDDGVFGEDTKAGVIKLQEMWGVNVEMNSIDGIVGKETMGELDRIFKSILIPDLFKTEEEKGGVTKVEEKSTAAQILENLEHNIGKRINNFGRIGAKLENYAEIKNGSGKKIFDEPSGKVTFRLKYNATVTVYGEHKDPVNDGWIYVYSTELDKAGWVQRQYVEYAPTPNAELYFVQSGDMLKDVVRKHYTNIPDDINDVRLLVNAVAMVNGGMKGLVYNIPEGEEKTNWLSKNLLSDEGVQAQAIWNSVIIKEGHNIWLPSVKEIQALKAAGILVPGSLTQELWQGFIDTLQFIAGVVAGFFQGLWAALVDIFVGAWDILKMIWFELTASLGEKIAAYIKIAIALKTWWDQLDVMHELKMLWDKFMYHSTPFEQGQFFGKIIGYLVFQILLFLCGALIASVVKWITRLLSEAGELVVAVFRAVEKLPEVKSLEAPTLKPGEKTIIRDKIDKGKGDLDPKTVTKIPKVTVSYNGKEVPVYRGGDSFKVKPSEVKYTKTGMVKESHGLSLDVNSNAPSVVNNGGAYQIESIPEELKIIQRGDRLEHFEIVPTHEMTLEKFQELCNQIKVSKAH